MGSTIVRIGSGNSHITSRQARNFTICNRYFIRICKKLAKTY